MSDPFLEADRINKENREYAPTDVRDKTIICEVITDSIVGAGQRDWLQEEVEQYMAKPEKNYVERIIRLKDEPDNFMGKLREVIAKQQSLNPGYAIEFYVACARPKDVEAILESESILKREFGEKLKIRAIAFTPCEPDVNAVQVEGIMLALRALRSNDIIRLRAAFKFLAKRPLTRKELAITDIDEFARRMTFTLPAAKVLDTEVRRLNDTISKNIKTAA